MGTYIVEQSFLLRYQRSLTKTIIRDAPQPQIISRRSEQISRPNISTGVRRPKDFGARVWMVKFGCLVALAVVAVVGIVGVLGVLGRWTLLDNLHAVGVLLYV